MSRGPGRIQRSIYALIGSDQHGAWRVSDICAHVYPGLERIEKKHRVAVNRALSSMTLPAHWETRHGSSRGNMRVLHNTRDPHSAASADRLIRNDRRRGKSREREREPNDHRVLGIDVYDRGDQDPGMQDPPGPDEIGLLDEQIEKAEGNIAFLESAGARGPLRHWLEELRSLRKRRHKLLKRSRGTKASVDGAGG